MNKTKGVIFLIVWFMWSAGQDLEMIARYSLKADYYIYSSVGLPWLFFVFAFGIFSLNIVTIFYLFRPLYIGYFTAIASLVLGAVQNITRLTLALDDLPGVRKAYENGRELRGMPIREEAMNMIFTPGSMQTAMYATLALYTVVLFFTIKNRSYFYGSSINA